MRSSCSGEIDPSLSLSISLSCDERFSFCLSTLSEGCSLELKPCLSDMGLTELSVLSLDIDSSFLCCLSSLSTSEVSFVLVLDCSLCNTDTWLFSFLSFCFLPNNFSFSDSSCSSFFKRAFSCAMRWAAVDLLGVSGAELDDAGITLGDEFRCVGLFAPC